ncbi:CDGSH iron-sulfur domain-containing protein [Methanosarcina vacuolata]|uniref:CDGSH iron-sulfur domain-containing protein n=1 Tax=Methanosarcina vacuolata TaxID=2215 RepID=UPI0012F6D6EE|nr:CDGSH iron-sulfur domain-containing protein [Methanosarcina vacuolata]
MIGDSAIENCEKLRHIGGCKMVEEMEKKSNLLNDSMKITVFKNGPYMVTGRVPLMTWEICKDEDTERLIWREVKKYPIRNRYALCRCGQSGNKPFCDGTHSKIHFDGTESGDFAPFSETNVITGSLLTLIDNKHLCVHAGFCTQAGKIWNLVQQPENSEARDIAIEEASNCPSGRLVIIDNATGKTIDPELEKSIVVVEGLHQGEHGPLWVRGGIPIKYADGKQYEIRNRVTLCRCGKSRNKPFCDGSHAEIEKD